MKTIQMTLDDDLVAELDCIIQEKKTNRSAFTRKALRRAIAYHHQSKLLEQHRKGYQQQPVAEDEFAIWEDEQIWDDK